MNAMLRSFTTGLLMVAVGGCAGTTGQPKEREQPDFTLKCVAVLPAVQGTTDLNRQPTAAEEKALAEGTVTLNQALREYFSGRTDIRMISAEDAGPRQSLAGAKAAAEKVGCNAILETTLHRYKERIGGEYTAKEPSSVSFSYRLLALPEGTVLCRGRVDEEQEPLMSNLLKFRLNAENSFTWVTAEQLLSQNLREQLNDCSFLAGKQ
jgi:hypothetical protein